MEQNYGGPVWHASVASRGGVVTWLEHWAHWALHGVGDAAAGEWIDPRPQAVHLRRRLSIEEAANVGPVVDIRGTPEAQRRLHGLRHLLPLGWTE